MQGPVQAPGLVVGHDGVERIGRRDRRAGEPLEHVRGAPLRPPGVEEFRVGDPVQPGGQGGPTLERGDLLPGGGEGLLREILGPVDVARQVNQETIAYVARPESPGLEPRLQHDG
jgi:hypothetical protein